MFSVHHEQTHKRVDVHATVLTAVSITRWSSSFHALTMHQHWQSLSCKPFPALQPRLYNLLGLSLGCNSKKIANVDELCDRTRGKNLINV